MSSISGCVKAHSERMALSNGLMKSEMQMTAKKPATDGWMLLKLGLSMTSSLCCVQKLMITVAPIANRKALIVNPERML